jgi:beta-glucosidase
MLPATIVASVLVCLGATPAMALDYTYETAEPQKTGWPLTPEEEAYVIRPEHERRPGKEQNKHMPNLWPVVPSAGSFGGRSWLDTHAKLVQMVEANKGPVDVLLVGDSITIQWGDSWKRNFPDLKAVNIGIGGEKTQNVLWRLDHGGVAGLAPKVVILMIGNNNMFFTPETGIEPVAKGIKTCAANLREKFPNAPLIVAKVLPAHAPGNRFYEDIKKTNTALDGLDLAADPMVQVLDLTADFTESDGTLKKSLFKPDNIHLSPAGYDAYAGRLKPMLEKLK